MKSVVETRILDSLIVAQSLFDGDRERKVRWLVVLSDMLEDSERARFEKQELSDSFVRKLIDRQKTSGALPKLPGVQVFVAGASARTSGKFLEVQRFWTQYLKEAGTAIEPGRYVRQGLVFPKEE